MYTVMDEQEQYERKTNSEWIELMTKFCANHFNEEGTRNLLDFYEIIQFAVAEELSEQEHYNDAQKIKEDNPDNAYMKRVVYSDL